MKFYLIIQYSFLLLLCFIFPLQLAAENELSPVDEYPSVDQVINIGVSEEILTLDPQKAFDLGSIVSVRAVSETLFRELRNGEFIPLLADALPKKVASDVYRITLKENIHFQNDTKLTASDVIFTFKRLQYKKLNFPSRSFFQDIRFVSAFDEQHLDFHTTLSQNQLLFRLSRPETTILSKEKVNFLGNSYGIAGILTTGPFSLRDWQKKKQLLLEKYTNYWGNKQSQEENRDSLNTSPQKALIPLKFNKTQIIDKTKETKTLPEIPYPGKIRILYFNNHDLLLKRLRWGNIQIALGLNSSDMHEIDENKKFKHVFTFTTETSKLLQLYVNRNSSIFKDKKTRKIISWSINRADLLQKALYGFGKVSNSLLPPNLSKGIIAGKNVYSYSPDKAKKILNSLENIEGEKFTFTLLYPNQTVFKKVAEVLKQQLEKYDMQVNLIAQPKKIILNTLYKKNSNNWDVILEDWNDWRELNDPMAFLSLQYLSTSPYNKTGLNDSVIDQLLSKKENNTQNQALNTILRLIADDCTTIPLINIFNIVAYRDNLRGINWSPKGIPYLEKCWISKHSKNHL